MKRLIMTAFASLLLVLGAAPAMASTAHVRSNSPDILTTGQIRTFGGNQYYLFSNSFNYGDVLVSGNGVSRTVKAPLAGTVDIIRLAGSNAPPDRCVVADSANNLLVHIGHCNAVGSLWLNVDNGDGTRDFINNHFTDRHLAGDNSVGDPWAALQTNQVGWYHRMFPIS